MKVKDHLDRELHIGDLVFLHHDVFMRTGIIEAFTDYDYNLKIKLIPMDDMYRCEKLIISVPWEVCKVT